MRTKGYVTMLDPLQVCCIMMIMNMIIWIFCDHDCIIIMISGPIWFPDGRPSLPASSLWRGFLVCWYPRCPRYTMIDIIIIILKRIIWKIMMIIMMLKMIIWTIMMMNTIATMILKIIIWTTMIICQRYKSFLVPSVCTCSFYQPDDDNYLETIIDWWWLFAHD